jgi:molybdopterin-guanine dinucleotide biosynthesis protein A
MTAQAMIDGFAFRSGSGAPLRLVGSASPAAPYDGSIQRGECIAIRAGASVPEGCDTVAAGEQCSQDGNKVWLGALLKRGANVQGSRMRDIPGLVLAGGRSSRMGGGDKSLRPLNGRPLLAHVLDRIRPQVSSVLINSNSDPQFLRTFGLGVRADAVPDRPGPLAGVLTGLLWAKEISATHLLTVPCDTPFLPSDLAARLHHDLNRSQADIAVARDPQQGHPVVALWPVHLAPQLASDLESGARSVQRWQRQFKTCESTFAASHFSNLNTPAELMAAEAGLAA